MLIPPPTSPAKKFVKNFSKMLETKCPSKLQGVIIKEYCIVVAIKFIFSVGTAFLILRMFKSVIIVIDKKKEIITAFMPTIGVKITKDKINTAEPII